MNVMSFKSKLFSFSYSQIYLKPLSEEMLVFTLRWRNFYRKYFINDEKITFNNHLFWFENYLKLDNDFVFIAENQNQDKIGQTALYHINWEEQHAEFGRIMVNPKFASQGYMKQACEATLKLATTILMLKKLYLHVKTTNLKAIQLYKNCGFIINETVHDSNLLMTYTP